MLAKTFHYCNIMQLCIVLKKKNIYQCSTHTPTYMYNYILHQHALQKIIIFHKLEMKKNFIEKNILSCIIFRIFRRKLKCKTYFLINIATYFLGVRHLSCGINLVYFPYGWPIIIWIYTAGIQCTVYPGDRVFPNHCPHKTCAKLSHNHYSLYTY